MSAKRSYRFKIAGQAWQWVYRSLRRRRLHGLCDYDTRTVSICTSVRDLEHLDVCIHEALHASQPFASEEHVAETAATLAGILWQLGYRLMEER